MFIHVSMQSRYISRYTNNCLFPHSIIVTRWVDWFPVSWSVSGNLSTRWEKSVLGNFSTRWKKRRSVDLFHPEVHLVLVGSLEQVLSATCQAEDTFLEIYDLIIMEFLILLYFNKIKAKILGWVKIHLSLKTCCFLV